jgi:Fic family protein
MLVSSTRSADFLPLLRRLDTFAGRWHKLRDLAPERLGQLRRVATIESVGSSTRIEGAELSDEEVADILRGLSVESFRSRDEQEVRGYRDLLELIFEQYSQIAVTENNLKQLHSVLLRYSEKDAYHRGEYKRTPNSVEKVHPDGRREVVFATADPAQTRWWMERLVAEFEAAWDSDRWHPLVLIADFVLWFLAIHPFQDGNGRLARAITTLLLLRAGYDYAPYASLERIVEDNKGEYYTALRASQVAVRGDAADYGVWLEFFLKACLAQQARLETVVERGLRQADLPAPQARILAAIGDEGPMTSTALAERLDLTSRTVRYHLNRLTKAERLVATTRRAGRLYSLPPEDRADVQRITLGSPPEPTPLGTTLALAGEPTGDFDPAFLRYAGTTPNGRAYATVVVCGLPSTSDPLGDADLDSFDALSHSLSTAAVPVRGTPEVAWWRLAEETHSDRLQFWLHPGPVVVVHWAMTSADVERDPEARLVLDPIVLAAYWRYVLQNVGEFMERSGDPRCAFSLNIQTMPVGGASIVDLDLSRLPEPARTGVPEAPPPWHFRVSTCPPGQLAAPSTLSPALDGLLRHYSYRHTAAAIGEILQHSQASWSVDDRAVHRA